MQVTKLLLLFFLAAALSYMSFVILGNSQTINIKLSDRGFDPQEITIRKGTTVIFQSEGKRAHWPASNFHPTHTEYPDKGGCLGSKLDSCRALKPGEFYKFKFNEVGSWGLHDHLFPGFAMVINVTDEGDSVTPPKGQIDFKKITPQVFDSLDYKTQHRFIKEISKNDPEYALKFLDTAIISSDKYFNKWHELTHIIGHEFYKKYGFEGIYKCTMTLGVGCHHGVTEQMFLDKGLNSLVEIEEKCKEYHINDPEDSDCLHGVGHALLAWYAYDLEKALNRCDELNKKTHCYGGVYMEYTHGAASTNLDTKDPWKVCRELSKDYQETCADELPDMLNRKIGFHVKRYSQICAEAPNKILQAACLEHTIVKLTRNTKGDIEEIVANCKSIEGEEHQDTCIVTAVDTLKLDRDPNWYQIGLQLCSKVQENIAREECYALISQ